MFENQSKPIYIIAENSRNASSYLNDLEILSPEAKLITAFTSEKHLRNNLTDEHDNEAWLLQASTEIISSSYLVQSSDIGESWLNSDLKYFPQAVDKQNNLISCSNNQFRKLNNNKWTLYEWENNTEVWGAEAINFKSGSNYISKIADIEFDNSNNLYLLVGNKSVFKTRLE